MTDFGIDHAAFEEAKKNLDAQIASAVTSMLIKKASGCTVTMKLDIERPQILDALNNPEDYIDGEELHIHHDVKVKVSFEYNKKGINMNRVQIVQKAFDGYEILCDKQESMFDSL